MTPAAPLLLATQRVLWEYAANAHELTPRLLLRPLLVAALVIGGLQLLLRLRTGRPRLAALVAATAALLLWTPHPARWLTRALGSIGLWGPPAVFLGLLAHALVLGGLGLWLSRRGEEDPVVVAAARFAGALAALSFLAALVPALAGFRKAWVAPFPSPPLPAPRGSPAARPDVYLVILDAYTRGDILRERLGHDNRPFLAELSRRGFAVAERSRSNYPWTVLSMGSCLNLGYLEVPPEHLERSPDDLAPAIRMLEDNRVRRLLAGAGYRTRLISSGSTVFYGPYDEHMETGWTDFERHLFQVSTLEELLPELRLARRRDQLEGVLAELDAPPPGAPPTFTLAHVMAPHRPFVFDAEGGPGETMPVPGIPDNGTAIDSIMGPGWYRRRYTEQLRWVNRAVLTALDRVLARRDREAIVVLMGDHGSRCFQGARTLEERMEETLGILNAYRVPASMRRRLYPEISPVNSFRLILGELLGLELPLLEDRSYFAPPRRALDFQELPRAERD